ncbi:MAG: hypothetical protein CMN78_01040 [Spirochaetales bacterium]|nr:hypothetical protein [Spirochaetales bacterium]
MKKTFTFGLTLFLAVSLAPLFAGPGEEVVVEEATASQFEGMVDIEYTGYEAGKKGGRFVFSGFNDPKTFNLIVADETSSTAIINRMYGALVRRNQMTLEWEPWLAESWTISQDQKIITYKLRDNLKWSDGTPLTAEDFAYSKEVSFMEGVQGSTSDAYYVGEEIADVIAVDSQTVRLVLPEVYAGAFNMSTFQPVPKHIVKPIIDEGGIEEFNAFWGVDSDVTQIVGCGPFLLKEYVSSQKIVMTPNPNYYEKDENGVQLPYIDEFVILIVEDQDTQLEKFLSGELDFYGLRGEDYAVLLDEKEALDFELYNVGPATGTNFITFNQNPIEGEEDAGISGPKLEWLSNQKFRRSIAHLIDRETIINNVAYGFGYPQYSFIPRFSPYYWDGVDDAAFKYDPETAKQLLDEIDYKDRDGDGFREDPSGNKIALVLNTNSGNSTREAIGEMIAQEAKKIGIDITFKPEDFNSLVTKLVSTYDWELIIIGLTGSIDPVSGSNVYPSRGNLHMIEPNQDSPRREWESYVDAAWDEANLTLDEDQRKSGFEKIQRTWMEQIPWAYTVNLATMHAYKTNWGNIFPHPVNGYSWDGIIHRIYVK